MSKPQSSILVSQRCLDFLTFSMTSICFFRNRMKKLRSAKAGFLKYSLKACSSFSLAMKAGEKMDMNRSANSLSLFSTISPKTSKYLSK